MVDFSRITLLLGPTNSGKTHRAIERMLEHDSGLIGVPLRLLAREIYDRVALKIGEERVALITGEERRVPRYADYVIATVEAMPTAREYDFVAVDEIQLAGHRERGHVFTERLLHARGRKETWFLGATTIAKVALALVPTAELVSHPRLSTLSYAGAKKLSHVPRRSAVVAFSLPEVYETAERLRSLHGGAAVVSGALSPRTRNAQVAMYQSGEVDFLVATDAIGMGLNLDVRHVAFMSLRKFDGRAPRELEAYEIAQIAGRAGRSLTDGTFGSVLPHAFTEDQVFAVESHQFPPLSKLWWRNVELDFSNGKTLLDSLHRPPPRHELRLAAEVLDAQSLERLLDDEALAGVVRAPDRLRLLWDVCAIPDYRKLLLESHVAFLRWFFFKLIEGPLSDDTVLTELEPLDDVRGEVDMLTARIARTRTWTFIAERPDWLQHPQRFRELAHAIEDRLSDALHAQLVLRFVDATKKPKALSGPRPKRKYAVQEREFVADSPFGALAALRAKLPLQPGAKVTAGSVAEPHGAFPARLLAASTSAFSIDDEAVIRFEERVVAYLIRGKEPTQPDVRMLAHNDTHTPELRTATHRRLLGYAREWVQELVAPLVPPPSASTSLRGLLYALSASLGALRATKAPVTLKESERAWCTNTGIELGSQVLYARQLATPVAVARRAILARVALGRPLQLPTHRHWIVTAPDDVHAYALVGYIRFGPLQIRADIAERLLGDPAMTANSLADALRTSRSVAAHVLGNARGQLDDDGDPL